MACGGANTTHGADLIDVQMESSTWAVVYLNIAHGNADAKIAAKVYEKGDDSIWKGFITS